MMYDYSPLNPVVWGVFVAAWTVILIIGNAYRKKYRFDEYDRKK